MALSVETPIQGGPAGNPMRVTGIGAAFEATLQYALTDDDGLIIEEGIATTDNGSGWVVSTSPSTTTSSDARSAH